MNNECQHVIDAKAVGKTFADGQMTIRVLDNLDLVVESGEMVAIQGVSGSGKSTLLHILGGLDKPTTGQVTIVGNDIVNTTEKHKSLLRNRYLGFVYQFHHLLPEFTALENVAMPLVIAGYRWPLAKDRAFSFLQKVGLENRTKHRIGQLSGGERQRLAIARALITEPKCLLADEPTGNLDRKTADEVFAWMQSLNAELQISFLLVTHDESLAKKLDRAFVLRDGCLF
jgi:lipoprotein-releasing system ATP-binding protein